MKELITEIIIPAKVEDVWAVLIDAANVPEWNPQIFKITGRFGLNEKITGHVYAPNGSGKRFAFKGKVTDFEKGKKLAWKGGVPGVLYGYHYWELIDLGTETKVIHGEQFYGVFTFLISEARLNMMKPFYEDANTALREYLLKGKL
ncbi:SRPBCC domain-containing protein [Bacillus sp. 165]|uniref:SRPBCC domain-containing protein n=1 Tax=Bacillus sp. 165 TaxID=1529117 RepID=UPI001ADA7942|nr:SRPBCC domain-containing protein [Bacillus sp. 165]MBO9128562.1 SRPBCC domain-containing protein [Bacillus sp. 165]